MLSSIESLYDSFVKENPQIAVTSALPTSSDLRTQFEYCMGRVKWQGLIQRLSFGDLVLVNPRCLTPMHRRSSSPSIRQRAPSLRRMLAPGRFEVPTEDRLNDKEKGEAPANRNDRASASS